MALINIDRNPFPEPISVKWEEGSKITNGSFIAFKEGNDPLNQELFSGKKLAEGSKMVGFVAEPFHPYSDNEIEADMVFTRGDVVRVFPIKSGIEVTVSLKDCIEGEVAKGDAVKLEALSTKLTKDEAGTDAIGYVNKVCSLNGQESVRIRFI